ncbi:MAG: acyl-CoA dehydrogenase family protein [Pigmentiphaga sp.]
MMDDVNVGEMLADSVGRLLSDEVTRDSLLRLEAGELDIKLWQSLEGMGLITALVPEEEGGSGMCWGDVELLLRVLGRHLVPLPLGESMIAAHALAEAGLEVPSGMMAIVEGKLTLESEGGVSGVGLSVPWASHAEYGIAMAGCDKEDYICLFRMDGVTQEAQETFGRIPTAKVDFSNVPTLARATAPALGELALLPRVATLRVAQIAGALAGVLELCIEYANLRIQFGKPIGKFQAIQQMIAELAAETAAAQSAAAFACQRVDAGDDIRGAMVAKTRASRAAGRGARIAHQVFGAIGVTDEHLLHYFTRRLWQWRSEAGSEHWWSERLGRDILGAANYPLWESIVD